MGWTVPIEPVSFVLGLALLVGFSPITGLLGSAFPPTDGSGVDWNAVVVFSAVLLFVVSVALGTAVARREKHLHDHPTPV